ncbi:MAG: hypothetical protein ONB52_21935 [candidate division KSB1 bacterium]|nr:hypothetical protein [candidate division KSB1 bacterium]
MATTVRDILEAAYAKSVKNRPGTLATETGELLQTVIRAHRGLYAVAARVNPLFFGKIANVTFATSGWPRPTDAEAVFRLEWIAGTNGTTGGTWADGTEIVVIPFDDRNAEPLLPSVYRFGQMFYGAGRSGDPTGGPIRFFYSKRPTDPANLDSQLDASWPEQFNELLVLEVAMYLAHKDGRMEELPKLERDRDRWLELYIGFLQHETVNERRRFAHVWRINTTSLLPLLPFVAPGAGRGQG